MASRKIQEINAGSMADIAFLLLIFYLVSTTMNVDSGLQRMLPQWTDPNEKQNNDNKVNKRNMFFVLVDSRDNLMVQSRRVPLESLKDMVKEFILNPNGDPNMPEKEIKKIDLIGDFPVSKGVISLKNDRSTSYEAYIKVQNELVRAFNEIRDEVSIEYFGGRKFADLSEAEREAVQKAVPTPISEAEPVDLTKGGGK